MSVHGPRLPCVKLTTRCIVPEDTFRILVATDNHIGYMERDPIRGQDSINSFKEILQLAVKNDVSRATCRVTGYVKASPQILALTIT